jgi:hypothetical protein
VLFGPVTLADVIERPVVNIDSLLDLEWAEFLLRHAGPPPAQRS